MLRPDIMFMGRGGIVGLLLDHLAFLISKGCRNDIGYFTIVIFFLCYGHNGLGMAASRFQGSVVISSHNGLSTMSDLEENNLRGGLLVGIGGSG
jgi:hypothetical protein